MRRRKFLGAMGTGALVSLPVVSGGLALYLGEKGGTRPSDPRFDDRAYRQTDRARVAFEEHPGFVPGFANVNAIATGPAGDGTCGIYVSGDGAVAIHDERGGLLRQFSTEKPVLCLAVDPDGWVFAGNGDQVTVYDASGRRCGAWTTGRDGSVVTGIVLAGDDVFVADAGARVIWRTDRSGSPRGRIGERDPGRGIPGLVVYKPFLDCFVQADPGADPRLVVCNPGRHRVETYSFEGDLLGHWGTAAPDIEGFCGCCNPVRIAGLSGGRVVTVEKGIARVKVHDRQGRLCSVVAGQETFGVGEQGIGLAIDERERVLLLDPTKRMVRIFEHLGSSEEEGMDRS
jgi:hypothetical protein